MSLITGLAIAVYLSVLGVDFAIVWGSLAFFMNFVPYIGSIIAAIPAVILSLIDAGPMVSLAVAAGFVVVMSLWVMYLSRDIWAAAWVFQHWWCSCHCCSGAGYLDRSDVSLDATHDDCEDCTGNDPRSRWISVLLSAQAPGRTRPHNVHHETLSVRLTG